MHPKRHRSVRVELLGGKAGGFVVEVGRLDDRIAIYRNGGPPYAADPSAPAPGEAFLGTYRLAGPIGPETPVYVAA